MSTELAIPADNPLTTPPMAGQPRSLVQWAAEASAANQLAKPLCSTGFVPATFKDKPGEATAAILAGYEVGLSPLAALNAIDMIQGRPSFKAITLRALVLSAGHDMWLAESTPGRCVVRGQRRGSSHVQESVWTIERATQMQLTTKEQWKKQPQAMLVARATSECARLVAPDVLLGVPYSSEEVADFDTFAAPSAPAAEPKRRTARRTTVAALEPPLDPGPPPTDDEHGEDAPPVEMATRPQLAKLHAAMTERGMTDRALGLAFVGEVLGFDVDSSKDLTKAEAHAVIDTLERMPLATEPVEGTVEWPATRQPAAS